MIVVTDAFEATAAAATMVVSWWYGVTDALFVIAKLTPRIPYVDGVVALRVVY